MKTPRFALFVLAMGLTSCSTGGGGTVLPSPSGDIAVGRACRVAQPDIIPTTPILISDIAMAEGRGSAADSLEALRMGFTSVTFDVTQAHLAEGAAARAAKDPGSWSKMPLTNNTGPVTLEVAQKGDSKCASFEAEITAQQNGDDPMKFWTDTRFPPAPPESRNWCVATRESALPNPARFTRTYESSQEGSSTVTVMVETLTDSHGAIAARRTRVAMYRPSFPIGISSVGTGCDGRTLGALPEFFGPTGIAFRAASPPTLVNK